MKIKTVRRLFVASLAALLVSAAFLRAAIPPAENLLPSDILFLVTAPDCAALRAAINHSPQGRFWNDPAMKPFHDHFMAKWNASFIAPLEHDLGTKLADFADLPQGQLTFAVTQNGSNGHDDIAPGLIFLLDAGSRSGLLKTNLAALQKKWMDAGRPVRTETIRGISFSIVSLASNDLPQSLARIFPRRPPVQELGRETKPVPPGELAIGQFESLLIVGNSIKALEPVAAHLTGGTAPVLGDDATFAADKLSQFRDAPLYYGWFNARRFFNLAAQIPPPEPNPDAPSPLPPVQWNKILSASGLMSLKSASFTYRESQDGGRVDFLLAAPEATRAGIFKILAAAGKDANPPLFVPADVVKFWRWRVDGRQAWAELEKMAGSFSPATLSGIEAAINMINASAQQKDPSFDLRKDLFGNIGDDFVSYQKSPAGTARADLNNAPSLFLFAAANPESAAVAVKNVATLMYGHAPEPRDFLGKKIYTIPLPARATTVGSTPAFYCAASGGYVALAPNSSMLENFIRSAENPPKPLREIAGLADAAQHVGGAGGGLFGYENQRESMRSIFAAFKNTTAHDNGQNPLGIFAKNFTGWMDFSLLPDYDTVAKYFYFSVYAGNTTAEGISFKAFSPRPPQLN